MIPLLAAKDPRAFPDVRQALRHPNGLLAAGGDLSPERLISAYRRGIFPWYSAGDPILWWSPDPRTVLFPGRIHLSRTLRKRLRRRVLAASVLNVVARVVLPSPRHLARAWGRFRGLRTLKMEALAQQRREAR